MLKIHYILILWCDGYELMGEDNVDCPRPRRWRAELGGIGFGQARAAREIDRSYRQWRGDFRCVWRILTMPVDVFESLIDLWMLMMFVFWRVVILNLDAAWDLAGRGCQHKRCNIAIRYNMLQHDPSIYKFWGNKWQGDRVARHVLSSLTELMRPLVSSKAITECHWWVWCIHKRSLRHCAFSHGATLWLQTWTAEKCTRTRQGQCIACLLNAEHCRVQRFAVIWCVAKLHGSIHSIYIYT